MYHFGNYLCKKIPTLAFSPGRVLPKFNSNIKVSSSLGFDISMLGTGTENGFGISTGRCMFGYGIVLEKFKYGYGVRYGEKLFSSFEVRKKYG